MAICILPLFQSLIFIMENFDSALKNLIITWLKRGYTPERIASGFHEKAALLHSLSEASAYTDAISEALVANRRPADIVT